MPEKPHCTMHQRYLNNAGACIDCEKIEMVMLYARDIVDAWPQVSLRSLGEMSQRIDTLRQALEAAKK